MKKQGLAILIAVAAVCFTLCVGVFLLRGLPREDVQILRYEPRPASSVPGPGLIDINTADAELLALLPGVGKTIAERIVEYRTEHGPFPSCQALAEVSGIGEKTLSELLPYITTGG